MTEIDNSSNNNSARARDRAIRMVRFLRELCELRTAAVRSISNYDTVIWLSEIPSAPECHCVARNPEYAGSDDVWVEITKPKLVPPPSPPEDLRKWVKSDTINDSSLDIPDVRESIVTEVVDDDEDSEPTARTRTVVYHFFADYPDLRAKWDSYVNDKWLPWAKKARELQNVQDVYNKLFAAYQKQQRLGETYEVVLGLGYLTRQTPSGPKVDRHLIVAQVNLSFDLYRGKISVTPGVDGPKVTLEQDMLEPNDRPKKAESEKIERMIKEMGDDIWSEGRIHEILEAWVNAYPDSRHYNQSLEPHKETQAYPLVSFAPAIIVRRRTERSLVRVYDEIQRQLEEGNNPIPVGIKALIDDPDTQMSEIEISSASESDHKAESDAEVYFPLPANEDQIRIATEISGKHGVLVQGPPGTGKSHTIANLVCHLLATGKRVLVTSHTARALKVLRDKFPEEIAPLCVIALSDDVESMKNLEASVLSITQHQNTWNPSVNEKHIDELTKRLDAARKEEAKLANDLRSIREAETYKHSDKFGSYCGTLQSIAARLYDESSSLGWLPFTPAEDAEPPLTDEEAVKLVQVLREFDGDRRSDLSKLLLDPNCLPSPVDFDKWVKREAKARRQHEEVATIRRRPEYNPLSHASAEQRKKLISVLSQLRNSAIPLLEDPRDWVRDAAGKVLEGREHIWETIANHTQSRLNAMGENASIAAG